MSKNIHYRIQNFMLCITLFVLGMSFYIEYVNHLTPCPLCIMQRFCTFIFGFLCMLGLTTKNIKRARILSIIQTVFVAFGLYFSIRQLWLQSLPIDASGQCLPGLEAMWHFFSFSMIAKSFLLGTSDCAHIEAQWMGISLPGLAASYFSFMLLSSLYMLISLSRQKN